MCHIPVPVLFYEFGFPFVRLTVFRTLNIQKIIQLHGYTPEAIVESFIVSIIRYKDIAIKAQR